MIVIFVGSLYSADFEAFLAEAMPIVESFQFDLRSNGVSAAAGIQPRPRAA